MTKIKIIFIFFYLSSAIIAQTDKSISLDTLNFIDSTGKKQGHWLITNSMLHKPCYADDQKVEERKYLNNKKIGVWTEYYCSGKIKCILTYVNGRPWGPSKLYYENGQLKEEGNWEKNRWVQHKKYTIDGNIDNTPDSLGFYFEHKGNYYIKKPQNISH